MSVPNFDMTGKVVMITGGRMGIGKSYALNFAEAGADVSICDWVEEGLEEVADEIRKFGHRVLAVKADVSNKAQVQDWIDRTVDELGDIDVLINNAAILVCGSMLEVDEETWDKVFNINLKGYFLCSQAAGRVMAERKKGCIINISSVGGINSLPFRVGYSITKAAVIMFTKVLARELGEYGIRVNAIAPGDVRTPMNEALLQDPEYYKNAMVNLVIKRIAEPSDIANGALFLASDAASYITGTTLVIDGGYIA